MDLLRSLPVFDPLALAQGLQAPPGAPDGPRVVCASAQQRLALRVHIDQLREALRAGWVPDAATRAALSGMARALDAPVEPLLQHVFAGARQADRRDEEEAARAARYHA